MLFLFIFSLSSSYNLPSAKAKEELGEVGTAQTAVCKRGGWLTVIKSVQTCSSPQLLNSNW